eukprot:TRINITY_DN75882_c0_g1_i1.p1 TRINITY_DN75882_c0_g1~~TRINITY_DN75882_c0_g1_i1.p1  ORF type:complete len:629 (-),score=200.80 TRINITY_DN75882_c0_g1_i1:170-2056(-)
MAKKRGGGRGGGQAGRGARRGASKESGIEKYGRDAVDDALGLYDDENAEDAMADESEFGEDDVMALEDYDEDEKANKKKKKGKKAAAEEAQEAWGGEEEKLPREKGSNTAGWRGQDFYGGDAAGDDSSGDSDEDLIFEEAKKLEELRAARLAGQEDVLGSLVGPAPGPGGQEDEGKDDIAEAAKAADAVAAVGAQFASVFAAEAETVTRDLSQLSETKKRGLVKKEMPELVPLLEDFQAKLAGLQDLLPLLTPAAKERVPATGKAYLDSKASLLLNTLANLSYYLLLRAEGGSVRSHPVVSQLVWLRELHESIGTLDKKLSKDVKQAVKIAGTMPSSEELARLRKAQVVAELAAEEEEAAAARVQKPRLSLRQRLEKLKVSAPRATDGPAGGNAATQKLGTSTKDLLKLPSKKKAALFGAKPSADAPDDLEEADPVLGFRRLGATVTEQLASVKQQLRERNKKEEVLSADHNVEARPRRKSERLREEPLPEDMPPPSEKGKKLPEVDDPDEDELIRKVRMVAKAKKDKKSAQLAAREEAKLMKQYHPENEIDGRRKTGKKILENRGLVRQRKNKAGNARVANRQKYDKMVKRRRGAVQEMREGAGDGATYDGEATGVRTHLRKSQRLS